MTLKSNEVLYVQGGLGRFHKATAVFVDPDSANAYLTSNPTEGVIAVLARIIFIAACDDLSIPLLLLSSLNS